MQTLTGHCLCGSVKFKTSGEIVGVINCHCKDCQRLHGIYNPMVVINKTEVTYTGEEHIGWYDSSEANDRGFCKTCGSAMLMRQKDGEKILISAGCFDDTSSFRTINNIFTDDADAYYVVPAEVKE